MALSLLLVLLAGCSSDEQHPQQWVEDEVSFDADGLTIHGTYRHQQDAAPGPAALLISESGDTDRNGDNIVVGPIGNMRQLAELLSDRGVASLRYDKVGTGKTGLGPYAQRPTDVVSAVYTSGAEGRGALPRRPARHRQGPHLGVRARRGHHPRDVAGGGHRARRAEDPLAGPASAAVAAATSTSSPTGCAPTRAPRR